ncbi:malto-oligosyltrehalose trehalohydrolase [Chitinophaga filiformis]|uniref:Malto-oligosyltrehalose trehalohydrolase n=1 Tax=Chitinophaga filiformis TaxID=104663 RepID=A0A1G7RYL6_CHIFI|nr:malto-oligosyltrehalose trehalohydrolase [Chitinophaga filiformis]SDG15852.1 maltooligosyl trehalose hydrolase [Chitinophaga filiformis]
MTSNYTFAGAALLPGGICKFSVWAPFRNQMVLSVLQPQQASYPMVRDDHGYWHVEVDNVQAGTRYKYIPDDGPPLPDPASRCQPEGVHGPSEVTDTHFEWTDHTWTGLDLRELVIYELHTGTFSPTHDFQGVIDRLEYLRSLGITAIEIMPVAQFPGSRNWGYDGVYPFAVQHSYGGVKGLKRLVNAAHQHGIAVILDVVYNHLGPEGNYFSQYGPWFTDKYKTPWGPALNFDDAWCDAVRGYYLQNALMWLDEFHIDGLRMDAVHAIWDCSAKHFMAELSEKVDELQATLDKKKLLIAEIDLNSPRYITPRPEGGYGIHAQWIDEFHHALRVLLTGDLNGYYADFGGLAPLAKAFRDSYVYTGQYSTVRKRNFGVYPTGRDYKQFVVFAQNHDQIGNRMLGERLNTLISFEAQKLAASVLLLSPHIPMLFMGEEYGATTPFQFFTSHSDKDLIAAVTEGRRKEFASFAWEGEVPDPQSEETFNNSTLSWETTSETATALTELYRFLIAFRKTRQAMRYTSRDSVKVHTPSTHLLVVERSGKDSKLLLLFNFSEHPVQYIYNEEGSLEKKFDSAAAVWNGPGSEAPDQETSPATISLQPHSAIVYEVK